MVHADIDIRLLARLGPKRGVGRQRPAHGVAFGPKPLKRGRDDVPLFPPQMAALAGMGVQAAYADRGPVDAKAQGQFAEQRVQHGPQAFRRDRGGHGPERQVRAHERDPQAGAAQQHHGQASPAFFRQVFGVAAERDAGLVDHGFLYRGRHHGRVIAAQAAPCGQFQHL